MKNMAEFLDLDEQLRTTVLRTLLEKIPIGKKVLFSRLDSSSVVYPERVTVKINIENFGIDSKKKSECEMFCWEGMKGINTVESLDKNVKISPTVCRALIDSSTEGYPCRESLVVNNDRFETDKIKRFKYEVVSLYSMKNKNMAGILKPGVYIIKNVL